MKKDKNDIDTSADSGIKGFMLQKLRAAERLLQAILEDKKGVFCTIEHLDDVVEMDMNEEKVDIKTEQNKNYEESFSINSEEIKYSLRIFLDNWRKVEEDENLTFAFYTTAGIKKERKVGVLKGLKEDMPEEKILQLLVDKKYDIALPFIVPVLKDYYINQHITYCKKRGLSDAKYYEDYINSYTDEDWKKFFSLISWKFNEEDENELRIKLNGMTNDVCDKLGVNKKYSDKILSCLIDRIEKQSLDKSFFRKMIYVSDVILMFKEFESEARIEENLDPLHKMWDQIENNDIRDLEEKILNVCPDFDDDILEELQDDFVEGKYEQASYPEVRAIKAYNYRIYKICKRKIKHILKDKKESKFDEDEIEDIINILTNVGEEYILDKGKTYKIPYKDKDMVRKTVLILLQECFIALDKVGVKVNE